MKKLLITFSGKPYENTTAKIVEDGQKFGADTVLVYDDQWFLDTAFLQLNSWAWQVPHKRGCGWYIWKPYAIWRALEDYCQPGDVVMYCDADCYPIANFSHLYEQCVKLQRGIMLFRDGPWPNRMTCKRDCYIVMDADNPPYTDPNQPAGVGRYQLFQKGPWMTTQFLMEWITYLTNPLCNTFNASTIRPEYPGFREHRCDQSVMTNIAIKYGIALNPLWDIEGPYFIQDNQRPLETRQTTAPVEGSKFRNV